MGIFDGFKKKDRTDEAETRSMEGWDAITKECERVYPNQTNPKHYSPLVSWMLGGDDPLDGISVYDGGEYWHFVTYGLSELYEKESQEADISGYGMEFTFKLKKDHYEDEEAEIMCICGILQNIARMTFIDDEIFREYEYLYTGQAEGIDTKMESNITGFITAPDTSLSSIHTPNGKVDFITFIGVTNDEVCSLDTRADVKALYAKLGNDVTDYNRESVV